MKATLRWIFLGPRGVRAGWRVLLFLAIVILAQLVLVLAGRVFGFRVPIGWRTFSPQDMLPVEGLYFLLVLVAAAVMARIEGKHFADYGWVWRRLFSGAFWEGAVWGLGAIALLVGLIWVAGDFRAQGLALHGSEPVRYAALWALTFLLLSLFEELAFRGYLLSTLASGMGFWPAAWLLAVGFGALHFFLKPYETWVDGLCTGLFGLFLALTLRRTGNLAFAIGFHALLNYGSMFLFGSPNAGDFPVGHLLDSSFHGSAWLTGGPLGAEASLFVFLVLAVLFFAFDRRFRAARFPAR